MTHAGGGPGSIDRDTDSWTARTAAFTSCKLGVQSSKLSCCLFKVHLSWDPWLLRSSTADCCLCAGWEGRCHLFHWRGGRCQPIGNHGKSNFGCCCNVPVSLISLTLVVVVPYLFYWREDSFPLEITASGTLVVGVAFPCWTLWVPPGRSNTDRCIPWVRALPVWLLFGFLASWPPEASFSRFISLPGSGCCYNSECCGGYVLQFGELAQKRVQCYYYERTLTWLKIVPT